MTLCDHTHPGPTAKGDSGTSKSRLLTAQIWLRDMADFADMNKVWDAWIDPENPATRCCGQVLMADPDRRIEVVVSPAL